MIDLSVRNVHKYYGSNHVIKGVSIDVNHGEKVGLLGKNGAGKTTLFKMITGDLSIDEGSVHIATGKKVEILAQIPTFKEGATVEEILRSSFEGLVQLKIQMSSYEGCEDEKSLNRYGFLLEEYERLGGYEVESKIDKICNGMNISSGMRASEFADLSGGEKTRVNLARILLLECDILLLDEPTNHLDLETLAWLEGFIKKYPGTVVMISHDRVFLDQVITRVIEIDDGIAHFYGGNYTVYAEEKHRRLTLQTEQYERQQKEIKRIEDRARWFVAQNQFTTKHHAILSRIDHMEKIEKPTTTRKLTESFNRGGHAAKQVLVLEDVVKKFGDKVLMDGITVDVTKNDRIGLIGPNGCGKTTLIQMIMGNILPDDGLVKLSTNMTVAYMSQIVNFHDDSATVLETVQNELNILAAPARSILARFNFRGDDLLKRIKSLSGGEKSRLRLCILMQTEANFLILDEPTNHLDIDSREWIENAVSDWDVTMLFISHDRYFLNKFASKIWHMNDGNISVYHGGFEVYTEEIGKVKAEPVSMVVTKKKKYVKPTPVKKVSFEVQIEEIEVKLGEVLAAIEAGVEAGEFDQMKGLYEEKDGLESELETLFEAWESSGEIID